MACESDEGPLDLARVRERHGLGALAEVTVTATDLAALGYCELRVVLEGLHPAERIDPRWEERRRFGRRVHEERAARLRRLAGARKDP